MTFSTAVRPKSTSPELCSPCLIFMYTVFTFGLPLTSPNEGLIRIPGFPTQNGKTSWWILIGIPTHPPPDPPLKDPQACEHEPIAQRCHTWRRYQICLNPGGEWMVKFCTGAITGWMVSGISPPWWMDPWKKSKIRMRWITKLVSLKWVPF